jgi:hypothetical protein
MKDDSRKGATKFLELGEHGIIRKFVRELALGIHANYIEDLHGKNVGINAIGRY